MTPRSFSFLEPYESYELVSIEDLYLEDILTRKPDIKRRSPKLPLALYGAGEMGKLAKRFLDQVNLPYLYVVDRNATLFNEMKEWNGVHLYHPDEINPDDREHVLLLLCIVTHPVIAIMDHLKECGWKHVIPFYDYSQQYAAFHPLQNGWFLSQVAEEERNEILNVYQNLSLPIDKAHYIQFILWRLHRIELAFSKYPITTTNRFFLPEVVNCLGPDEVFTDCGAFHGAVTNRFIAEVDGRFKAIHMIEPDTKNYRICELQFRSQKKIHLVKLAVSKSPGSRKFYNDYGLLSKLSENGTKRVEVTSLDELNLSSSFIKLHLEGGELDALAGGQNAIKNDRPIIAVTAYHNSDGIWRIPRLLMKLAHNYRFHFRLHSWAGTGAVYYALPKERINHENHLRGVNGE